MRTLIAAIAAAAVLAGSAPARADAAFSAPYPSSIQDAYAEQHCGLTGGTGTCEDGAEAELPDTATGAVRVTTWARHAITPANIVDWGKEYAYGGFDLPAVWAPTGHVRVSMAWFGSGKVQASSSVKGGTARAEIAGGIRCSASCTPSTSPTVLRSASVTGPSSSGNDWTDTSFVVNATATLPGCAPGWVTLTPYLQAYTRDTGVPASTRAFADMRLTWASVKDIPCA